VIPVRRIRTLISTTRRSRSIRIIAIIATARRVWLVNRGTASGTTWRGAVAPFAGIVVVMAGWRGAAAVVVTRTIATGWGPVTTRVVAIRRRIAATAGRR
jgi:hypothetical protein